VVCHLLFNISLNISAAAQFFNPQIYNTKDKNLWSRFLGPYKSSDAPNLFAGIVIPVISLFIHYFEKSLSI